MVVGPLFLKQLLIDQVTTTSEASLASLILVIDTYNIKSMGVAVVLVVVTFCHVIIFWSC